MTTNQATTTTNQAHTTTMPAPALESLSRTLTTAELNEILRHLPGARIARGDTSVTVTARRRADGQVVEVLTATTDDDGHAWHVAAVSGLLTARAR